MLKYTVIFPLNALLLRIRHIQCYMGDIGVGYIKYDATTVIYVVILLITQHGQPGESKGMEMLLDSKHGSRLAISV